MSEHAQVPAVKEGQSVPRSLAPRNFQEAMLAANMYARSSLVPQQYRGKQAECFVALQLANRQGVDPLMLMQNSYVVGGRPGVEGKYAIALMNARGPFKGGVHFEYGGKGDNRSCTAWGIRKDTGERCEAVVDMEMAKAEGWTKNQKWRTLRDLMLAYRSGAFLARMYCPEVLMGMQTIEEIQDVIEVQAEVAESTPADGPITPAQHALIAVLMKQTGVQVDALREKLRGTFEVESRKELTVAQAEELIGWLKDQMQAPDYADVGPEEPGAEAGSGHAEASEEPSPPPATDPVPPPKVAKPQALPAVDLPDDLPARVEQPGPHKSAYDAMAKGFKDLPKEPAAVSAAWLAKKDEWVAACEDGKGLNALGALRKTMFDNAAEQGYPQPEK